MSCLWRRLGCRLRCRLDRLRPSARNDAPKSTGQARRDRIATESARNAKRKSANRDRIATESARNDKRKSANRDRIGTTDAPKSTGRAPIGRPPPPFSVGRAVLDPRSLNFFALHCAFLQKSCKKGGRSLHCAVAGGEVFFFQRKVILFHRKVREKSEKSQRKVREKS